METPCTHVHTEDCWRQETHCVYEGGDPALSDSEGISDASTPPSGHICSEDTGCVINVLDCRHQHDQECGYAPSIPGHPCEFVCPICSRSEASQTEEQQAENPQEEEPQTEDLQAEAPQTMPYYLLLIHSLDYQDTQYGFSEVIKLTEEDFQDGAYDLHQHVLHKEGMETIGASCFSSETEDLEDGWTLSPDSFLEAGDPENGDGYLAAQALIEYQALDGFRPVLDGDTAQSEDPYGIMPLTSFQGGNIKDITFVPADVITVRLQYKYSPTGGLAGMDAADSQVFQIKIDNVERDGDGNVLSAGPFTETWDLPCYNGTLGSQTLEGFRIVLDPKPLNDFLNDPVLAEQAMEGKLSQEEIQQALENDSFSVNTGNSGKPVYQWQVETPDNPPAKYEDYLENPSYHNRYSDKYNEAWDDARSIQDSLYTARAFQEGAVGPQGANALNAPQLSLELTQEQCVRALTLGSEITLTVYYRRNAGFYHVGHWVPQTSLSRADVNRYTAEYPDYNNSGSELFGQGYLMVCLERKQGRVGALTNARANPPEAERILSAFIPRAVNQKTIEDNTRVDILYDTAARYGLIFQTEESYIPRQYVNLGDQVTFIDSGTSSSMEVIDSGGTPVSGHVDYKNPVRQGYSFAGWKYEVRNDVTGTDVIEENGKSYKRVATNAVWEITSAMLSEAVVIRDSDSGDAKMIYLYPVWSPDRANVRVVFWAEALSGSAKDVKVEVDETPGGEDYCNRVDAYLSGTPNKVGTSFANVGSFTFTAPTNSALDLSVNNQAFSSQVTEQFTTTGEAENKNQTGTLKDLIDTMFPIRMPDATTSTGSIDTSEFYYPYQVEQKDTATYTVAPDGSTVINVYYARKVYKLDFVYYGEISQEKGCFSGTGHQGPGGLMVATNTIGYSVKADPEKFDYDYQDPTGDSNLLNRWQPVKVTDGTPPDWTVPQWLSISAKYDADLREVWPLARGEEIPLTLYDEKSDIKDVAVFMSWGATAGPFNESYRDPKNPNNESTIIGNYRSMSADIIADPKHPETVHHLVAYWWNKELSAFRRNACYEVPKLKAGTLLDATDVKIYDLTERKIFYNFTFAPQGNQIRQEPLYGEIEGSNLPAVAHVTDAEKIRRDTLYLVPVNGSLSSYFEDYQSNLIEVDENGEPKKNGGFYAVRRISLERDSKVYALGRQALSFSSNYIIAQAPSAMPNMTSVSFTYDLIEAGTTTKPTISVDHDTRAWDNWGKTATSATAGGWEGFVALGTTENPYDIWFYYDREQFTIYYMVASRNSTSGEYEIGQHETYYGQSMKNFNLKLKPENARMYSNDTWFTDRDYWTPADNTSLAFTGSSSPTNGLKDGYTRLCPDSAEEGKGAWVCKYWSLDRSGSGVMTDADWEGMITGHLRVFAQWTPPNYRVKFDFDGGSYNDSEEFDIQTVKANVGYTSSGKSIPSPTKDGFVFNGWTWYEGESDGNGGLTAGSPLPRFTFETPITRDIVLKAKWDPVVRTSYHYKIWYLTDEEDVGSVDLPQVEGEWLPANRRGTPHPESPYQGYTHVLGCQYVGDKAFPENTILSLAALAIPGYAPVKISATLALEESKNHTGAADTENVAYFYYRKSQVKSYTVRFQLWDKTGEEGILTQFTTQCPAADSTYFTPSDETWRRLREAGYYLVQMDREGKVLLNNGEPIAAGSYLELSEFINEENNKFAALDKGTNAVVTFKVAPYFYTIQYHVGTLKRDGATITPSDELRQSMQAALDQLSGVTVQTAVAAGKNPTRYVVADFDDGYSFTLKNPIAVRDPADPSKEWRFTGWTPAPGTTVVSRAASGEFPELVIERSEGNLEFLANWELTSGNTPPSNGNPGDQSSDPNIPDVPATGDSGVFPWGLLFSLSLFGLAVLCRPWLFQGCRKEKD